MVRRHFRALGTAKKFGGPTSHGCTRSHKWTSLSFRLLADRVRNRRFRQEDDVNKTCNAYGLWFNILDQTPWRRRKQLIFKLIVGGQRVCETRKWIKRLVMIEKV